MIYAAVIGRNGEALVLDMGGPIRILDLAEQMIDQSSQRVDVVLTGFGPGEKLHEALGRADDADKGHLRHCISHVVVPQVHSAEHLTDPDGVLVEVLRVTCANIKPPEADLGMQLNSGHAGERKPISVCGVGVSKPSMTDDSPLTSVVCFANAQLPDSDYRVSFALQSRRCRVALALPERPAALLPEQYESIGVGAGLTARSLVAMLKVPLILKRRKADVALFFATQFATFGPLLSRLMGCRPVITITGRGRAFVAEGRRARLARALYLTGFRINARLCSAVLFQNSDDMARLIKHLPPSVTARCTLIGSAVDMNYFNDAAEGRFSGGNRVLMISRLIPEKGVRDYLEVAESLSASAHFTLIGPPSQDDLDLSAAVERAHTAGVIEYRGPMSSSAVRNELRQTDVLVLPSHSEGFPRVALEAAASGVAVVAYDIPGCRAALGPEHPLVPLRDRVALVASVASVIDDRRLREQRARQARLFVEQHHSAEAYVDRLEKVIL